MLKIVFGEIENSVYHPPTYFDNQYEDEWITNPLSVAMIKDIDKSKVIGTHLIQSPVLDPISTKEISGKVRALKSSVSVHAERLAEMTGIFRCPIFMNRLSFWTKKINL